MKNVSRSLLSLASLLLAILVSSCMGPEGPTGPQGPGGSDYPVNGTLTYTITGTTAGGFPFSNTVTLNNYVGTDLTSTVRAYPPNWTFRLLVNDSTLYMNRLVLNIDTDAAYQVASAFSTLTYRQPFGSKWLEFNQTTAGDTTTQLTGFSYNPTSHQATGSFAVSTAKNSTGYPALITGSFDLYITEIQ